MEVSNFEKHEGSRLSFDMNLEGTEYRDLLKHAARELEQRKPVPGFRVGKAPLERMAAFYGAELYELVSAKNAMRLFGGAVLNHKLEPVGDPSFRVSDATPERMTITATVAVYPEVTLRQYRGLEVDRPRDEVTEAELDALLEQFRDLHRLVVPAERPAGADDIVVYSSAVECDGIPLPAEGAAHVTQRLDGDEPFPGLKESMFGKNPGDTCELEIDMPMEHPRTALAGKHIRLSVRIEEVKERRLQALTDALVHEFNKDCATVANYREKLRGEQNRLLRMHADEAFEKNLRAALAENVEAEIPPEMVETQLERLYQNLERGLRMRGTDTEAFLRQNNMTREVLRAVSLPGAMEELKISLAREKIVALEQIEVTSQELAAEYEQLAKRLQKPVAELKSLENDARLLEDMKAEKAMRLVRETAIIRTVGGS